ncbi:MAG: ABC transporter substrate-binding protein [Bacillota bacterium]|nr:ABC transporter substrate-binding protein [Bacillota bacterium]
MKLKMSKIVPIMLMLILGLFALTGCGSDNSEGKANQSQLTDATDGEKTIVDQNGRTVEIPEKMERVVTGRILPFPAVYYLASGSCEELVGIHPASKSAAENSMLKKLAPEILKAQTGFVEGKDINVEELLKLNPDLVYLYGDVGNNVKKMDEVGVPAVAIQTMKVANGDSLETLNSWLDLLGQIMDKQERADEIITYGHKTQAMIDEKLKKVPQTERPEALMIFRHSEKEIEVSGSGFFGHHWLLATGAQDVAEEIKVKAKVNMEQIYNWNPEIIYITNFTETQSEDLINNTIKGQDWSKIKAVQEGKVYKIPLGIYRWFPPSGDTPLMLKWLAQKNNPQLFSDYRIEDEISDYYSRFYNYNLSDEEIEMILNPVRAAAKGY